MHPKLLVEGDPPDNLVLLREFLQPFREQILEHALLQPLGSVAALLAALQPVGHLLVEQLRQLAVVTDEDGAFALLESDHEVPRTDPRRLVDDHPLVNSGIHHQPRPSPHAFPSPRSAGRWRRTPG